LNVTRSTAPGIQTVCWSEAAVSLVGIFTTARVLPAAT
jgi:hypothetical protein